MSVAPYFLSKSTELLPLREDAWPAAVQEARADLAWNVTPAFCCEGECTALEAGLQQQALVLAVHVEILADNGGNLRNGKQQLKQPVRAPISHKPHGLVRLLMVSPTRPDLGVVIGVLDLTRREIRGGGDTWEMGDPPVVLAQAGQPRK